MVKLILKIAGAIFIFWAFIEQHSTTKTMHILKKTPQRKDCNQVYTKNFE